MKISATVSDMKVKRFIVWLVCVISFLKHCSLDLAVLFAGFSIHFQNLCLCDKELTHRPIECHSGAYAIEISLDRPRKVSTGLIVETLS